MVDKDIELTIRLKNNQLKQRRMQLGLTQKNMANFIGIGHAVYGALENLRYPVKDRDGEWTSAVKKIADFFDTEPSILFPEWLDLVQEPVVTKLMDYEKLHALAMHASERKTLEEVVDHNLLADKITEALDTLKPRDQSVVSRYFGIGTSRMTLEEIAKEDGVTRERIRQILSHALRGLRHPSRAKLLKPFIVEDDQ